MIHQSNIFFQYFVPFKTYVHTMTKEYALVLSQTNKPSVKTESDHINLLAQICLEN